MHSAASPPGAGRPHLVPAERKLIAASLFGLAGAAWAVLLWQAGMPQGQAMGLTMAMSPALFLAAWVVMMVAMMFPAAAPMVLMFARVHAADGRRGRPVAATSVFVSAYLLVWTVFGAAVYVVAVGIEALSNPSTWPWAGAARIAGGVLILAGLYQRSALKQTCLSRCRTPLDFIMRSWREGHWGAFRMGWEHGLYCLGCCWLLFVLLLALGIMNVAAMAVITLLIVAEKSLPAGDRIGRMASLLMMAYGLTAILAPGALPMIR